MNPEYLFVYGTLLPNQPSEVKGLISRMRRLGPATVEGRLYDLGEYPGAIIESSSSDLIHGEVYELPSDENTLAKLDSYEEFYPAAPQYSLFVRTKCRANLLDGRVIGCWIYIYNQDVQAAPIISSGKYAELKAS